MLTLKSNNLNEYFDSIPGKVLLIFASPTCPVCKKVVPLIEQLLDKKQLATPITPLYIDGNKWDSICDEYNIGYFPTLILTENGVATKRLDGCVPGDINKII